MFNLIPLIIVFPIVGLFANLVIGKRLGARGAGIVASLAAGAAFVVAILQAVGLAQTNFQAVTIPVADWIVSAACRFPGPFRSTPCPWR